MKNRRINFKSEKGLSFVEVLLSVALLAIIAGPLLGAVYASFSNNIAAKDKTEAVALAERVMEEIKAVGVIGEIGATDYAGFVNTNFTASYNISKVKNNKEKVSQAITTGSTEQSSYKDKIDAANAADFVLEIDQGKEDDGFVNLSFRDNMPGSSDIVLTEVSVSESLNFKIENNPNDANVLKEYTFGNISYTFLPLVASDIKLKVIYINNLHKLNESIKIGTSIPEGTNFEIYVMDDDQSDHAVSFTNNDDSKASYDVTYLDSTYFNYSCSVNELFKITVDIKKKGTNAVVYTMSSYVKK